MARLILLDRDGVINVDSPDYIKNPAEWQPLPGALQAIVRLREAGCRVAVCTNQAGIGRGLFTLPDLQAIHGKMLEELQALGGDLDAKGHLDALVRVHEILVDEGHVDG